MDIEMNGGYLDGCLAGWTETLDSSDIIFITIRLTEPLNGWLLREGSTYMSEGKREAIWPAKSEHRWVDDAGARGEPTIMLGHLEKGIPCLIEKTVSHLREAERP